MATRVELPKEHLVEVFNVKIASLKRAINTTSNKLIKEIQTKELNELLQAQTSLTEIK